MKSIQSELETIRDYLTGKIRDNNFKMVRPPVEGDEESPLKLVRPKVTIGNIPHSNFPLYVTADERFYQAPYLLVGYESARFGPNDEEVNILIQGCSYTAVNYEMGEDDVAFPDNEGVLDVTQMLERVMTWIREIPTVPVMMDYTIGSYATQAYTYPYNFGYLAFKLETSVGALPRTALF